MCKPSALSVDTTEGIRWIVAKNENVSESSLERLPRAYRVGLRLRALGADDDLIADCLDVDPSAVAMLLYLGVKKLEHVAGDNTDMGSTSG